LPNEIVPSAHPPLFDIEKLVDVEYELPPNKVQGPYLSNWEYLQRHYELLREDAIRPLRKAVEEVRDDPSRDEQDYLQASNVGIYEPTYIKSVVCSFRGLAIRVAFSLKRVKKYIHWKQSKRLISGTVVALSPVEDGFKYKCVLATVAARPLSALEVANPPELDLFVARPQDLEIDPTQRWIMVECRSSFFEASRHTLLALQHMVREPFPLSEHIVKAKTQVDAPRYVENNPHTDMSSLVSVEEAEHFVNVNILQEWPAAGTHSLDESQSKALNRILTKRLAIIQGPPGTGKTHVSVVALKMLLANRRKDDPPIIVTCQTNHALDQLLRHVAEFEPRFVRLGGRSKDTDKIKKRTLFAMRMQYTRSKESMKALRGVTLKLGGLKNKIKTLLEPLNGDSNCLDHRFLVEIGLLTEKQAESLNMQTDSGMGFAEKPEKPAGTLVEQWLGTSLVTCRGPIQPDDFRVAFEDDFDEVGQLEELEAEAAANDDDDDIEALKGCVLDLSDNPTGRTEGSAISGEQSILAVLRRTGNLRDIPMSDRGTIYQYFQKKTKEYVVKELRKLAVVYAEAVRDRKIYQLEHDQCILAGQPLIGMTTTGLSKYRGLIASLRPRIVLVEEAAETLEAPVTAACVPTLEHLILVGDHQQLRPHCQVGEFEGEPYHFNLSLFERMVNNNIDFDCLTRQRRMIPEIRRLLEPIYGNTLTDHDSVTNIDNRPPVEGMGGCNSFFFTHEWPESRDNNMSVCNEMEADMVVGLFKHLVLNGIESPKITILSFYNGQRTQLLKKLRSHPNLRGNVFKVLTVDSYQGEENDIVLLSLTRSNKNHKIGFLSVDNRVCVALSRAKRGFYMFGNAKLLACQSAMWGNVIDILRGSEEGENNPSLGSARRIGDKLPVQCTKHGKKFWIGEPDDWEFTNGGCGEPCKCLLLCGHICTLKCHP
jgi:helicase required for RNAi-mediated heterochromatin assembly 1